MSWYFNDKVLMEKASSCTVLGYLECLNEKVLAPLGCFALVPAEL